MGKWTLVFIFMYAVVMAFPPRNFSVFENNCLRLHKGGQSQYLCEYFKLHANLFTTKQKLYALGIKLVVETPNLKAKAALLNTLIKLPEKGMERGYVFYECALLHYFQGKWKKAETFFKLSKGPLVDFYLGKLALRKNSSLIAQARLERFVETHPSKDLFWGAGMLALAELAYKEGNYQKAYLLSIKSKHESAQRAVLLHKIYLGTRELDHVKRIEKTLRVKYHYHPIAKRYLREMAPK